MKKTIMTFLALALAVAFVQAQSLADNSYYAKSLELESAARVAFEEGDYDAAANLAAQAQENAQLSDEYVAMMLSKKTADEAISAAQAKLDWAAGVRAEARFPEGFLGATTELAAARSSYDTSAFAEAVDHAKTAESYLSVVTAEEMFPAFYIVREAKSQTDCLWRIAALPFVYNDPLKWPLLYKANMKAMPEPKNPDLIEPGMTLAIPSAEGEPREGTWTEGLLYPTFGAVK